MSLRHVLLLVVATACWGCGTVLSKLTLDRGVGPLSLLVIELASSCLLLVLAAVATRTALTSSRETGRLALLGLLNPGAAYALGLLGLATVSASTSVLIWATEPVLVLLLAAVFLRERVAPLVALAIAAALVGVVLVLHQPGASGTVIGVGLTVAAVTCCGLYTVLTRRFLLDDSAVAVVVRQQSVALMFALALVGGAVIVGSAGSALPTDVGTWVLAVASGVTYYGVAFWCFVAGLRGVPATTAGSLLPLIPVFGLGAAAVLVGDRLDERQWVGSAIVVVATAFAAGLNFRSDRLGSG